MKIIQKLFMSLQNTSENDLNNFLHLFMESEWNSLDLSFRFHKQMKMLKYILLKFFSFISLYKEEKHC